MTTPDLVDLNRPRDLGALLSDSVRLYRRSFWRFLAIAFAVVVPVNAIVLGLGLGEFTGGFDSTPEPAAAIVPTLVQFLVVLPLIAVMALHALQELAAGRKPGVGESIQAGLDAFAVVFWPVLIAVLCEVGVAITIIGPIVLIVRWYFVPQLVVLEGKRGTDALRASWELTRGFAWRTAGVILVGLLLFQLVAGLLSTPVSALARSMDSEAMSLAAETMLQTLVMSPIGVFAALVYFDLQSRQGALRT